MSQSWSALAFLVVSLLATAGEAAAPSWAGRDRHGDPLPVGALARCGTARLRPGDCQAFALSPDGKTRATVEFLCVRLWDARTGREIREIEVDSYHAYAMSFTPDGRHLLVHSDTLGWFNRPPQPEDLLAVIDVRKGDVLR